MRKRKFPLFRCTPVVKVSIKPHERMGPDDKRHEGFARPRKASNFYVEAETRDKAVMAVARLRGYNPFSDNHKNLIESKFDIMPV